MFGLSINPKQPRPWLLYFSLACICLAGCGTNFEQILFQIASAAGRTAVDSFVTDVANTVAGVDEASNQGEDVDNNDDDAMTGGEDAGTGNLDGLVGDTLAGKDIFATNNCSACHCADGSGGCALDAPSIIGVSAQEADETLRGGDPHAGGKFSFSDQELVDVVAYLTSL